VSSVFGRTGDVTASSGDYSHSQISGISSDDHHTRYSDEEAQDAVGTILTDSGAASVTYDDAANTITISATDTDTQLSDSEVQTAINNDSDHGSTASHNYTTSASGLSDVSPDSDPDAHHAVFEPADYTPGSDVSKSDVGLANVPNVNPRSEMRNLGLQNEEMDSSWVGGQSGGQVGYDASVGLFLDYGSAGSGVSKDVYPVLDAGNTKTGSNVNVTYGGIDTRPKISLSQGNGSGLDADKVDGKQASQFMRDDFMSSGDLNNDSKSGIYRFNNTESNRPGNISYGTLVTFNNKEDTGFQLVGDYENNYGGLYWRGGNSSTFGGSGSKTSWLKIWHEGNDGSGSGLDADKVDGYNGSDLAALSEDETITGKWTVNANGQQLEFNHDGQRYLQLIKYNGVNKWAFRSRNQNDLAFYDVETSTSTLYLQQGGSVGIRQDSPDAALDVNGKIKTSEELKVGAQGRLREDSNGNTILEEEAGGQSLKLEQNNVSPMYINATKRLDIKFDQGGYGNVFRVYGNGDEFIKADTNDGSLTLLGDVNGDVIVNSTLKVDNNVDLNSNGDVNSVNRLNVSQIDSNNSDAAINVTQPLDLNGNGGNSEDWELRVAGKGLVAKHAAIWEQTLPSEYANGENVSLEIRESSNTAIQFNGSTAPYRINIQDGSGRVHHRWNAYWDGSNEKFDVGGEGASYMEMDGNGFYFRASQNDGSAGNSISWNTPLELNGGTVDMSGANGVILPTV